MDGAGASSSPRRSWSAASSRPASRLWIIGAAAHRELLASDAAQCTVGELAARWGFLNPGRFAAAYRARYGVSPSVTLRRNVRA
ncbi:MAG: AraC family transcriptional regulator [Solirubrobacterales bacterium]|nr:AraC family transcriptional regulator [Solirubrobacterales bacterium]MBV9714354.1 AraC family transcriptional regulator [Solirubrobacterales bacterium]